MNMEPMISSDAVTEIFSKGVAIKVSDCSPNFQQLFSDAREVGRTYFRYPNEGQEIACDYSSQINCSSQV